MGIYNVSKHAVVSLTETLYQDLKLVSDQVSASVLCPYFVPTGISQSHRNRPADMAEQKPTQSQLIGQAMSDKAVGSGKVTAAQVAQKVFDAIAADQFYIYSHPRALGNVSDRMNAIVECRKPARSVCRASGNRHRPEGCAYAPSHTSGGLRSPCRAVAP
jgi:short-subunit dehydrogenase